MLLAQRITAVVENSVSSSPSCPSPLQQCLPSWCFPGKRHLLVLRLFWAHPQRRQECLTQQSRVLASCLSTAAAAVTAWVSLGAMRLLRCLPSIAGRGWHHTRAAPPIRQLECGSFLCQPETGSAE